MPLEGDARPLSKDSQLARGERRYRRQVASPKRWQQIEAAKAGPCRVCLWIAANPERAVELGLDLCLLPTSFHHTVPKGSPYFGSDTEACIVPLGGSGTTGHHGQVEARHPGACLALVEMLSDDEYSYAVERGGEGFLERRYGIVFRHL